MGKRKDGVDPNVHPQSSQKRPRTHLAIRPARSRAPQSNPPSCSSSMSTNGDEVSSSNSTNPVPQPSTKPSHRRTGFRAARSQEPQSTATGLSFPTSSRVTTIALGHKGCLKRKHKERSHTPAAVELDSSFAPTDTQMGCEVDSFPPVSHQQEDNSPAKNKRKRNNDSKVCNDRIVLSIRN